MLINNTQYLLRYTCTQQRGHGIKWIVSRYEMKEILVLGPFWEPSIHLQGFMLEIKITFNKRKPQGCFIFPYCFYST